MSITLRHNEVTIRKPRYCYGCNQRFAKGSDMMIWVGICDGFQSNYWCLICDLYISTVFGYGDEIYDFCDETDYKRFKLEVYENSIRNGRGICTTTDESTGFLLQSRHRSV